MHALPARNIGDAKSFGSIGLSAIRFAYEDMNVLPKDEAQLVCTRAACLLFSNGLGGIKQHRDRPLEFNACLGFAPQPGQDHGAECTRLCGVVMILAVIHRALREQPVTIGQCVVLATCQRVGAYGSQADGSKSGGHFLICRQGLADIVEHGHRIVHAPKINLGTGQRQACMQALRRQPSKTGFRQSPIRPVGKHGCFRVTTAFDKQPGQGRQGTAHHPGISTFALQGCLQDIQEQYFCLIEPLLLLVYVGQVKARFVGVCFDPQGWTGVDTLGLPLGVFGNVFITALHCYLKGPLGFSQSASSQ